MSDLEWPWLFWVLLIICGVAITGGFLFLKETYVPVLLAQRKKEKEKEDGGRYYFDREDNRPLTTKVAQSIQLPLRILFTRKC